MGLPKLNSGLAALLVVVGGISFGMLGIAKCQATGSSNGPFVMGNESKRVSLGINCPAEFRYMTRRSGKHVVVPCPSPQVDEFSTVLSIQKILGGNRRLSWRWGVNSNISLTRPYKSFLFGRDDIVEHVSGRKSRISNFTFGMDHNFFGGSVAAIAPFWTESPIVVGSNWINFPKLTESYREYEGGLIGDESLLGKSCLSVCDAGQNNCKNGNDEGGQCSDCRILADYKTPQAIAIDSRSRENGNTLIRGFIVCLALLATYALLKRI